MNNISIVEVRAEFGAGTRGASLGIDAIKLASTKKGSSFFKTHPSRTVQVEDYSALYDKDPSDSAKNIAPIKEVIENTSNAVADTASKAFPVVLAGDHSIGAGTLMGMKKAFPEKRIGVIWIDAHADLHTPFTSPSGNVHGMPLAMCINEDNTESAINEPPAGELAVWKELKSIGGEGAKIRPDDIVFIALRAPDAGEQALVDKYDIPVFTVQDVEDQTPEVIAQKSLDRLKDCDLICVSFDVDSMDPSVSLGTGTPVPGGLTAEQAMLLNTTLIKDPKVGCWEMVEVNPLLDTVNKMAEVSFDILEAVVDARN